MVLAPRARPHGQLRPTPARSTGGAGATSLTGEEFVRWAATVGENTQGVYSEIVSRTLPNDWNVLLPTEVYETAAGRSFDGVGVAPDVRLNALRREDLDAGKDPIIERALALLR